MASTRRRPLAERARRALNELFGIPTTRSAFRGGDVGRLTADWIASLNSPDDEIRGSLRGMRARGRELARNNAYATQYFNLLVANVLGPRGMGLQAQVRGADGELDTEVNEILEAGFARWASQPVTLDGTLPLVAYEHLQLETAARDGEAFNRTYYRPDRHSGVALQGIDPDLVDDSYNFRMAGPTGVEVRMGVEVDQDGQRLAYHIIDQDYLPGYRDRRRERIPASEMLHLYRPKRAGQTRGVTWLASAMSRLNMLYGFQEAELVAARTAAAKMGFLQWREGESGEEGAPGKLPLEASPGTIEQLPPGMEFESWSPEHPSTAYEPFVKNVLREIAAALGVSYHAIANDLTDVNYSSIRAGMLIEKELWRVLQQWWITSFRQPVYEHWLRGALLTGEMALRSRDWRDYRAVRWVPRGWQWVDPMKDGQASQLALDERLTSRTRILAEQGIDFEDILEELKAEQELADQAGISLETAPRATGVPSADDEEKPSLNGTGKAGRGRPSRMIKG